MATDGRPPRTVKFQQTMQPVGARFDAEHASMDGGARLLTALDERLTRTEDWAACLPEQRDPRKVQHALRDLLRQRVFGVACGYKHGTEAARLADDPMHKLAVGPAPLTGAARASQPTRSRVEHAVGPWARYRRGRTLAAAVIAPHRPLGARPGTGGPAQSARDQATRTPRLVQDGGAKGSDRRPVS